MSEINENKNEKLVIGEDVFVPFLTEDVIQNRIKEMAAQISQDYKGKIPIFIGVLNGAFIFLSDLIKNVSIDCASDKGYVSKVKDKK